MVKNHFNLKKIFSNTIYPGMSILIFLLIINAILDPHFFSKNTLYSNLSVITPILIATIAQSIVIFCGELDLSIGATITLVNVIIATNITDKSITILTAILLSLVVALIVGAINGLLVGYLRLPSLVATFSMSVLITGVVLLILPTPGGYVPEVVYKLYQIQLGGFFPITILIIIFVSIIWWLITRTSLHRYIYAVGGNEVSAEASGIPVRRIKFYSYLLSSVFIWISGLIITAQASTGDSRLGASYTLTTIAAAIMGGISLSGGSGRMLGAAFGACIMIIVSNIIFYANIPSFYQEMIKGLIIIIALTISAIPKFRQRSY